MPLQPYQGLVRKLVLAFDIGTTFSGVGYTILDPGEIPKIQGVTRFPGQENGDFKIPSILWYTKDGLVRAAGAEARSAAMMHAAEDEGLVFVEWFKLHLRPKTLREDGDELDNLVLHPLPPGKTVVDVFADFLKYLFSCTRQFIVDTHPSGDSLWASVESQIEFVLSHPNGWEGAQQSKMRQAAVFAGLVPEDTLEHRRMHFVTEGEASLHYCIDSGLATDTIRDKKSVIMIDAGGGTIDLSTYQFHTSDPPSVEEVAPADCIVQGSTRINGRARRFLRAKLRNSRYGNDDDLNTMMDNFERSVKPTFKDPHERSFVKFGSMRDKDPDFGIRSGQLAIEGRDIEEFFAPSVLAIMDAVLRQRAAVSHDRPVEFALLVGGFAASPWLFVRLRDLLREVGLQLSRPDNHTNKAVAEGSVSFFLQQLVSARIARFTYGVAMGIDYNPAVEGHFSRRNTQYINPSGRILIPNAFCTILKKGVKVCPTDEQSFPFCQESSQPSQLNTICSTVLCYKGANESPQWTDTDKDKFLTLCVVSADTSQVVKQPRHGPHGIYYRQDFNVVLSCGLTELEAHISWLENGIRKCGPAKILYDDESDESDESDED